MEGREESGYRVNSKTEPQVFRSWLPLSEPGVSGVAEPRSAAALAEKQRGSQRDLRVSGML